MFKCLVSCLSLLAASCADIVSADYLVAVENIAFHGNGRFPELMEVYLSHEGIENYLKLERDDETTKMLSESVFEASSFLPTGLFKQKKSKDFAAYDSGNSDVLIVHREAEDADPKFYGRFTQDNEKLVIQSEGGSHVYHRVRREEKNEKHQRVRRDTSSPENVIELFVFADLSIFEHFQSEMMPLSQVYDYVRRYLPVLVKEVDAIYDYLSVYGINKELRVYFQQFQIIMKSNQQNWIENNLSGGKLQTTAVTDFQAYYYKLYSKLGFPYPDHVMAITKLEMEGGIQVMSTGSVCEDPNVAASIIRIDNVQAGMAQAIALTFGVSLDGDGNSCQDSDQYIMSTTYGAVTDPVNQGNRWKFSPCSVTQFQSALDGGMDLSCLQTEDKYFNWNHFNGIPFMSERITVDEQCVIRFQSGATFCDESNGNVVDCYSSTQGCFVAGVCQPFSVSHFTSCGTQGGSVCQFGFCNATISTTSTTTSTTPEAPERENYLQTTTPETPEKQIDCLLRTSVKEYDLPGCSCSGCGSNADSADCVQAPDCIGKKVRVTTKYVHESCAWQYQPGPRRVITKPGEVDKLKAEVFQGEPGKWKVQLITET